MRSWIVAVVTVVLAAALLVLAQESPRGSNEARQTKQKAKNQPKAKGKAKQREPLVIPDVARDKLICFCLYTVHNKILKLSAQL